MNWRFAPLVALLAAFLLAVCSWVVMAADAQQAPKAILQTASGRTVFWRGERVVLSLTAPLPAPAEVKFFLASGDAMGRQLYAGPVKPVEGIGYTHLLIPTETLGNGRYRLSALVNGQTAVTEFVVRETTATSPGMIFDESGASVAPNAKLARQTAAINFMTDGRFNATGTAFTENAPVLHATFDRLMDNQLLFWSQDASRPFSFNPPHSAPETNDEYLRRLLLGNAVMMRYPAFAGYLFDYDNQGFYLDRGNYNHLASYWGWGNLREALGKYMDVQEQALIANFRKETGLEPLTSAEALKLAAALHVPEGMGYIDLPTRRWAYEIAARSPEMNPQELATLKQRAIAWYGYLMSLNKQRYTGYLQELRALDPTLAYSTSNTINHSTPRSGGDHATSYEPLDFRFVAVWDDQGGAPEHIYETALAATLLNGNRNPAQPLWIDTVYGWQNGNIFRNALLLAGRGAQGTGYAMEMGANLGAYAVNDLRANAPRNQEVALTGQLMERFGGLFARARQAPRLGLLYSNRQGVATPYTHSYVDGMVKAIYLLSHIGLPPALVTETMLMSGVPQGMDVMVVLGQTEALPAEAEQALRQFAARGGRVIADTATTVPWEFVETSEVLDLPFRDLGHPYNMMTAFNRQDATIGDIRALAADRCPRLRALLQSVVNTNALDATNPDVAVCTLRGGAGTFVAVANDSMQDLSRLFTRDQQLTTAYQQLFIGHGTGAIGSWMPLKTELLVGPALSTGTAIYDLFEREIVTPQVKAGGRTISCDLTGVPGRLYALYPTAVGEGKLLATQSLTAGEYVELQYRATDLAGAPLAAVVPVEMLWFGQDGAVLARYYRATNSNGVLNDALPTDLFLTAGTYRLQVTTLLDGRGITLPVTVKAGSLPKATLLTGATVRDPESIRRFLAERPEIVVPVFDAVTRPYAEHVVAGLTRKGVKARVWDQPPMVNYPVAYVVKEEEKPEVAKVDRGEAIGKVLFQNGVHHINGNFYGSAMTGFRYGKHILLLGIAGKNPVLDGVQASGVLWGDHATETPGGALVQRIPWALGRHADTLVVLGADPDGLTAGVNALLNLPPSDPVTDGVRLARERMLREHGLPLTYEMSLSGRKLSEKGAQQLPLAEAAPRFALSAVMHVQEFGELLVVTLNRYGNNLALVDRAGKVRTLPAISSTPQVAFGKSVLVTASPGMTLAWDTDGRVLWRMMGTCKGVLPGSDDVLVESEKQLYRVTAHGECIPFTGTLPGARTPEPVFKAQLVTEKVGAVEQARVKLLDTRNDQEIPGFTLTPVRANGNAPWTVEETLLTAESGNIVLAFKRYPGVSAVQYYTRQAGKVLAKSVKTAYLTDAALSRTERTLACCGMEGDVWFYDLAQETTAHLKTGAFPRLFPLADGGFAIGTADGLLTVTDSVGKTRYTCDLVQTTAVYNPEEAYRAIRGAKLITRYNPPSATGALPLDIFYWYLRDADGDLQMINFTPGKVLDFRWLDVAQGQVAVPESRPYTITAQAAAKYFDEVPRAQPSWKSIVELRRTVVTAERPTPGFRVYLDNKPVGMLTPQGGALKPFVTAGADEGWALLNPKPEEMTTFTGTLELPAGSHMLGLEALGMQDCYLKELVMQ